MTHDYDRLHERVSPQNEIVVADSLDARQQEQSHEWQAEQKEGKKHENDAHGLEVKALSNGGNQKHGSQENRDPHVLVSGLSGFCTLVGHLRSLLIQTKELFVLRIVIVGHENRAGWRFRVVERIGAQPGCESGSVLVAKPSLKKLRRLLLPIELGSEPTIEGIAVVDPLLPCHCGKAFSRNSELTRFGIFFCTLSGPLCRLIPAPCGRHGNQGEYHRFDNFNRFKAGLRRKDVLAHLI